ncbi:MAG TPA: PepSY domain-containing protein [Gammaproteobacteria bacterium]
MKRLTTVLLILLALGAGAATAAPTWQGGGQRLASNASGISLDQAAERVRQQTGGRILSAETVDKNGERVHRIKVLTPDHKVVIREINASGR